MTAKRYLLQTPFAPEHDETFYSFVAQCHIYSGNATTRYTLNALLDSADIQVAAEFPSRLPHFSDHIQLPLQHILDDMLDLHFYRPFTKPERYRTVCGKLCNGDGSTAQLLMASIANRLPMPLMLRFCPQCMQRDREQNGHSFWHLRHHLPGVYMCAEHRIPLHLYRPGRRELVLPFGVKHFKTLPFSESALKIATLCEQEFFSHSEYFEKARVQATYQSRLCELGLITRHHRIRQEEWRSQLLHEWKSLGKQGIYKGLIELLKSGAFPQSIMQRSGASHHPLKHLLIIGHLFGDWPSFIKAYRGSNIASIEDWGVQPSKAKMPTGCNGPKSAKLLELLRNGHSLRQVSQLTQTPLSSLKIFAAQHQLANNKRPSKIFPITERAVWRKLLVGESATQIASKHKISVGAVEQILRSHPYLLSIRQRIRFLHKRTACRKGLKALEQQHPEWTRDKLRRSGSTYMWLYKNDSRWLYENLPLAIPRALRPRHTAKPSE